MIYTEVALNFRRRKEINLIILNLQHCCLSCMQYTCTSSCFNHHFYKGKQLFITCCLLPSTVLPFNWDLLYFFGHKTKYFSFQSSAKNLDLSYKMDLDFWDCSGRVKLVLKQNFIGPIYLLVVILERGKPCLIDK